MEGYYWRLWDAASGRAVVALCGVCRAVDGPWAVVALAAEPGGFVRWRVAERAAADPDGMGTAAWDAASGTALLRGTERRIAVDLGPDARLEAALEGRVGWPLRLGGIGMAHLVPGLPQYWQPAVLGARVRGSAALGAPAEVDLDGWDGYVEKNWGGAFPGSWWWGQAGFGAGAAAAFAGGRLLGRVGASAVAVRLGGAVVRLAPPAAVVRAEVGSGSWRLRARSPRYSLALEGERRGAPHILPVPVVRERRAVLRSEHHLAGRMSVELRRGRRLLLRETSELAGLELGTPAD